MTMKTSKVGRTVYPITIHLNHEIRSMNFYLYEDEESLMLIDGGFDSDETWKEFNKVLKANNFKVGDIDKILLTHHHPDHIGMVNRVLKIKDVPVYAHSSAIPRLNLDEESQLKRLAFFEKLYAEMECGKNGENYIEEMKRLKNSTVSKKFKVNAKIIPVADQDKIGTLTVIETPGHSPDHVVFYDKKSKILFGGDFLLSHISSNAIIEPDVNGNRLQTLMQYIKSFNKLLKLDVDIIYPGHYKPIYNGHELVESRLAGIVRKADEILEAIKLGYQTGNDLALYFYKDKYESEFELVLSEIIGHLDYLENKNKVNKVMKNRVWNYYSV